ncbi:hypothetical protein [Bradyrhizobium erythrophlei]|uniref:hypothetical protein n=1 Tax=Bradyrhizobium erythrophlei TaxID=1437360 RepID=UPI0011600AD9|nr:hypothetical protein [Bradyrhizobium erythrophlei]
MVDEDKNCPDHDSTDCYGIDDQKHQCFAQQLYPLMKRPQCTTHCGPSGKIACQCNDNTSSPVETEAAANISSSEVQSAVPVDGTLRMLRSGDSKFRQATHSRDNGQSRGELG